MSHFALSSSASHLVVTIGLAVVGLLVEDIHSASSLRNHGKFGRRSKSYLTDGGGHFVRKVCVEIERWSRSESGEEEGELIVEWNRGCIREKWVTQDHYHTHLLKHTQS